MQNVHALVFVMDNLDEIDDELDMLTIVNNYPIDFAIRDVYKKIIVRNKIRIDSPILTPPFPPTMTTDPARRNKKNKTKIKHKSHSCKSRY